MSGDPVTIDDWQEAVDAARGALALDSARKYGLVTGGPTVDVERCEEILRLGQALDVVPADDAVERFVASLTPTPAESTEEATKA